MEQQTTSSTETRSRPDPAGNRRPTPKQVSVTADDLPIERALKWARERPNDVFMIQPLGGGPVKEYTWAQTVDEAKRMASYLKSLDFPRGSAIGLLSKNCAHFIMMDLAIWMAGHVSVALYPTLDADTINYVLEHCEARALLVGKLDEWPAQKRGVPARVHCISCQLSPPTDFPKWEDIVAKTPPLEGSVTRGASETALLMYTSGSTGKPKGVEHDFASMASAAKSFSVLFPFSTEERVLSYLPLAHAFERAVVESPALIFGFKVYFAESLDTFVADLQRARPTVFHSVPRLWLKFRDGVHAKVPEQKLKRLLRIPILGGLVKKKVLRGLGLEHARFAVTGSAPTPQDLMDWYRSLGLQLLEGYGMTENFSLSHVTPIGQARAGRVGIPAPDVEVRLAEDGEIQVKSPASMRGYYRQPELTAEAFTPDGYLRTGDRGEIDKDGYLKITGRTKELFKTSKGKYVAPAPIENIINTSGVAEQSCVMGTGEPQPYAVVMLAESVRLKLAKGAETKENVTKALLEMLDKLNAQLNEWEQLSFLAVAKDEWTIMSGLLTPTMKIKRSTIEERYGKIAEQRTGKERVIWEP